MSGLTKTQKRILTNIRDGARWDHGRAFSMSAAGGWDRSITSCYRHGWLDPKTGELTDAGRAALAHPKEGEPR